jgi:hypothetical protein
LIIIRTLVAITNLILLCVYNVDYIDENGYNGYTKTCYTSVASFIAMGANFILLQGEYTKIGPIIIGLWFAFDIYEYALSSYILISLSNVFVFFKFYWFENGLSYEIPHWFMVTTTVVNFLFSNVDFLLNNMTF